MDAQSALKDLHGLTLFAASHAADMREFGFRDESYQNAHAAEWYLHLQCPWRLPSADTIITGLFDWHEPADSSIAIPDNWDPATGGSLQALRIAEIFKDAARGKVPLFNKTNNLVVSRATGTIHGDLTIELTGGFELRVFPAGSVGESWRIFKKGDLSSHYVWGPRKRR